MKRTIPERANLSARNVLAIFCVTAHLCLLEVVQRMGRNYIAGSHILRGLRKEWFSEGFGRWSGKEVEGNRLKGNRRMETERGEREQR